MQDMRTLAVLQMTVALVTSANPNYNTLTVEQVSDELVEQADDIDHVFGICACPPDEQGSVH